MCAVDKGHGDVVKDLLGAGATYVPREGDQTERAPRMICANR